MRVVGPKWLTLLLDVDLETNYRRNLVKVLFLMNLVVILYIYRLTSVTANQQQIRLETSTRKRHPQNTPTCMCGYQATTLHT